MQIATLEKEFAYNWQSEECHLWFFNDGLPGYAWYVPKQDGYINVGLGGKAAKIKAKDAHLRDYWNSFTEMLAEKGLVCDAEYEPTGYSYYLRGSVDVIRDENAFIIGDAVGLASIDMGEGIGPAVSSAILAADAILNNAKYDLQQLSKLSVPGFFRNRSASVAMPGLSAANS